MDLERRPDDLIAAGTGAGQAHPPLSAREAADTLIRAIARAGRPWHFIDCDDLRAHELDRISARAWPLVLADGQVLGLVVRANGEPSEHDDLIRVLQRTVSTLVDAERASADASRRVAAAEEEARIDPLTGLLNRRAWENALVAEGARMRRSGGTAILVMVDIDLLKETNDSGGHLAGDMLIRRTGATLRRTVREEDIVARLGGDEFGIIAVESPNDVDGLVARIESALRAAEVRASVGAATSRPGEPPGATLSRADRNMYAEKRRRKAARS